MPTKKAKDELFLMYKGKPLTRSENTLYYGDPSEKYILRLQITDTEPLKDLSLPYPRHYVAYVHRPGFETQG